MEICKPSTKKGRLAIPIFIFFFICLYQVYGLISSDFNGGLGHINENMTLWADIYNNSDFYAVHQANITVYDPERSKIIDNQAMAEVSAGIYTYSFTPTKAGTFYAYVDYYNTTGKISIGSQSFSVIIDDGVVTNGSIPESHFDIFLFFVLFIIGMIFVFYGYKTDDHVYTFIGAIIMSFISFAILKGGLYISNGMTRALVNGTISEYTNYTTLTSPSPVYVGLFFLLLSLYLYIISVPGILGRKKK